MIYHQVFDMKSVSASKWEQLFKKNNFGKSWRDGIYTSHHYHSTAHEALGCYSVHAQVRLGGDNEQVRKDIELNASDCILISTGVAHKNMGQSSNFDVVGAYDLDGKDAEENVKQIRIPRLNPGKGENDVLIQYSRKGVRHHIKKLNI